MIIMEEYIKTSKPEARYTCEGCAISDDRDNPSFKKVKESAKNKYYCGKCYKREKNNQEIKNKRKLNENWVKENTIWENSIYIG